MPKNQTLYQNYKRKLLQTTLVITLVISSYACIEFTDIILDITRPSEIIKNGVDSGSFSEYLIYPGFDVINGLPQHKVSQAAYESGLEISDLQPIAEETQISRLEFEALAEKMENVDVNNSFNPEKAIEVFNYLKDNPSYDIPILLQEDIVPPKVPDELIAAIAILGGERLFTKTAQNFISGRIERDYQEDPNNSLQGALVGYNTIFHTEFIDSPFFGNAAGGVKYLFNVLGGPYNDIYGDVRILLLMQFENNLRSSSLLDLAALIFHEFNAHTPYTPGQEETETMGNFLQAFAKGYLNGKYKKLIEESSPVKNDQMVRRLYYGATDKRIPIRTNNSVIVDGALIYLMNGGLGKNIGTHNFENHSSMMGKPSFPNDNFGNRGKHYSNLTEYLSAAGYEPFFNINSNIVQEGQALFNNNHSIYDFLSKFFDIPIENLYTYKTYKSLLEHLPFNNFELNETTRNYLKISVGQIGWIEYKEYNLR